MQRLGSRRQQLYKALCVNRKEEEEKKESLYETLERRIEELRREWAIDGSLYSTSSSFSYDGRLVLFFFQPIRNDGYITESMMCFWILFSLISKYSSLISVFVRPAEICRIDDLAKKKNGEK